MKLEWKKIIPIAGAFVVYQFYKLWEFGNSIVWKTKKYELLGATGDTATLKVSMEILNPSNRTLKIRGIDGVVTYKGNVLATYNSGAFTIPKGISTMGITFQINTPAAFKTLNTWIQEGRKGTPVRVKYNIKLPYFTTSQEESIMPQDIKAVFTL